MSDILACLYKWLGPRSILLPIPFKKKGPIFGDWQSTTFERTQEPDYQRMLRAAVERGGNIGVLLTAGQVTIDVDDSTWVDAFAQDPLLAKTLRSQGKRGCNFWLRMAGDYPNGQNVYKLKSPDGKDVAEWRCGPGAQTVIWGEHPDSTDETPIRYRGIVKAPEIETTFPEVHWPSGLTLPWKNGSAPSPVHQSGQHREPLHADRRGDQQLNNDLIKERTIKRYGSPAFFDKKGITSINERFWAGLLAAENVLVHEPDEKQFYRYQHNNGLYIPATDHAIRELFSDRILSASREWKDHWQLEQYMSSRQLSGVIMHLRGVSEARPFNDPGCKYIHCRNCVLELTDDGFRVCEFSPRFWSRNRSPIEYQPEATCERFINEVLGVLPDEDKLAMQKLFGSMLMGYNVAQKILMLHGEGGSGKTTAALIFQGCVGNDNISELRTKHLDERFEIARFLGKSLLMGVDVDSDFLNGNAISRLKGLVGGDFLDAERKSSNDNFRLHGVFNVLITSNARLRVKLQGDQSAWRRRLVLINYTKPLDKKPIRDFDKIILREEGPGILLWGLEGLRKLRQDLAEHGDIVLSDRQREGIESVLEESDSLRIFLKREIVRTEKADDAENPDLSVDEIVSGYLAFCIERKWVAMLPGAVQRQLESLILEYFGVGKSNDIPRSGKSVRGFRKLRFKRTNEE